MTLSVFVDACRQAIGAPFVLTDPLATAPFLTDWRRRYHGAACAVLRPANTEEVAALVKLAVAHRVPLVPQGGNTGLAGGATPDTSGGQAVLSLTRLKRIRNLDPENNTLTVEAGAILADIQARATEVDRLFALSLAAEGSCTIGGNLATNAGGTAVLRYGNAREQCLGIEVVTPQGDIWNGLRGLRKDNSGYDLRDLFIGSEGTLGVITCATLKLQPRPAATLTALAALASPRAAVALLALAQQAAGPLLTGFELISEACIKLVGKHYPQLRYPFHPTPPQTVLLECSDHESEAHARVLFETLLEDACAAGIIMTAAVAENLAQSQTFWALREHIPLTQAAEGLNIKHDIALPISSIAHFIEETDAAIQQVAPGARMITFGHLGDGNLHYNVQMPKGGDAQSFLATCQSPINRIVYDNVHRRQGSVSAEHGLGQLKIDDALRYKSDVEIQLMRTLKAALDPLNLMNPGKVLR